MVVACQIDVFPAQGRQMGQIAGCRIIFLPFKMIDSALQIRRITKNDGGHDQIQPARAVTLILIGAVADFTEPVEEHRSAKRILLLTLVEPDVAATTQLGILQPLQREQCTFQFAEFL